MSRKAVIIGNWPFLKGEKAKLIWIGEPYKYNNKWMFKAYFKGSNFTRRIQLDWASVHFLVPDKYYVNGDLNNGEAIEDTEIIDINLKNVEVEYKERPSEIKGAGFKDRMKSKTFNFHDKGILYSIPVIEVIRAILAPSDFLLNRILEMDSFENYFIYEFIGSKLEIHFTSEYESKLLKDDKINHLAWILTNSNVLKMFNKIGQVLWESGELKFDFLLSNFNIKARVKKKEKYVRVLEILSMKKKRINAGEINTYHPSLEESQITDEAKKRKYINKTIGRDRNLTSDSDGSTKTSEEINTALIEHEYEQLPKINRKKTGRKIVRKREDENTRIYIEDDNKLRTTADVGGERLIKGLEFNNIENMQTIGELEDFIDVLKLLRKKSTISSIEILINVLPEGIFRRKFARLSNGITRRKYAIGKIIMRDGKECSLIEIERENKSLSMLILKVNEHIKWNLVYSRLLIGLVEKSGNWSNKAIKDVERQGVIVCRIKHIKKNIYDKVYDIYKDLYTN